MKWYTFHGLIVKELHLRVHWLRFQEHITIGNNIWLRLCYQVHWRDIPSLLKGLDQHHHVLIEASEGLVEDIQARSKGSFWLRVWFPRQKPMQVDPDTYHVIFKEKLDAFRCMIKYNARYYADYPTTFPV